MRLTTQIKPISYVKANAAQIIDELADGGEPVVVTQNGEAKAVLQSVADFEQTHETLAMLRALLLGLKDVKAGRTEALEDVVAELRGSAAPQ